MTGSVPEVTSFDRKSPGSGCGRPKTRIYCAFRFLQAWLTGGGTHVTGNDVTRPQVSGSDPEVTSFDRKSPGSGCRRTKTRVYCVSLLTRLWLARGGSHVTEKHVTLPQVTGSDPEVTSFDRKSFGSGCTRAKTCVYCAFHFLQGSGSQ